MGVIKKNKVSLNPLDYNCMLLGSPKVGKTTLAFEVCEKLLGSDGYALVEIGNEDGASALEGAMYINTPTWHGEYDELTNSMGFIDFCNDVIENKSIEYPNLKVLVIDTFDQLTRIGELEAIRLWNKKCRESGNPDKCTDVFNAIWGGYDRPRQKVNELIDDVKARLHAVGVRLFIIGHIKTKDISDPVIGETYQQLTSDCSSTYFNNINKTLHFLALAYTDRNIVREKTGKKGFDGKDVYVGKITGEARKIKFRDDAFAIDSGSRFADIVDEVPMTSDDFINAMVNAIESESKKSGRSLADTKKEQDIIAAKKAERVVEAEAKAKVEHELANTIDSIVEFIQNNRTNMDIVKPIVAKIKSLGYDKLTSIDKLEDAEVVLALCK